MGKDIAEIREQDNAIMLTSTKALYIVYPQELRQLIMGNEEILYKSLKRGKSEMRYRANERRNNGKFNEQL